MNITATYDAESRTMAVTFQGETRTFPATLVRGQFAYSRKVLACKFPKGDKMWPAEVTLWLESGKVSIVAGHNDKGGARAIVGWWQEDNANNTRGK